jgi:hypothetical protein
LITALEEARYTLTLHRDTIKELGDSLRIEELRENVKKLEEQTQEQNFWNDQENSSKVLQTIKQTKDKIEDFEALSVRLE